MSKYNKQLSVIDSESIATQPDSEGGVIWPENTFVFQSEVVGWVNTTVDPAELYIRDSRFPSNCYVYYSYDWPYYHVDGFPDGVEVIQVAVISRKDYINLVTPINYQVDVRINHPEAPSGPSENAIILMIQFNKNPFA